MGVAITFGPILGEPATFVSSQWALRFVEHLNSAGFMALFFSADKIKSVGSKFKNKVRREEVDQKKKRVPTTRSRPTHTQKNNTNQRGRSEI